MKIFPRILLLAGLAVSALSHAERLPVLKQIDLPHPYYFREMYLPQLTAGPSSLAWSPDSQELIYSMAGSLWRQKAAVGGQSADAAAGVAHQLTAGSYDYQPDWSPDGRWVIYSSYRNDSLELWVLDVASGAAKPLLANGAVNVEPRFSPDGRRIAFVSTTFNKRFHIFTADFSDGTLAHIERLTGEHKSELPRYYYSAFDHEINPLWTRDGKDIIYVSNRNHIYGTGGFWRIPSRALVGTDGVAPAAAQEIHYEETNWKARPDVSPDGSRLVYSSYLGRSWHNLWVMPSGGGDAFALGNGDWDQTYPRWSPDGTRIAFISNRSGSTDQSGGTEINIQPILGGVAETLGVAQRRYLKPMARLHLLIQEGKGDAAARVSVTDTAGRFYAPANAWISADDSFDRSERHTEAH
jgi:TolB protein